MESKLPKLNEDDYLNKDYEFWKNYREKLTLLLKEYDNEEKIKKTPGNIYNMYLKCGLKATARYFNINNSQVMYYVKKYK